MIWCMSAWKRVDFISILNILMGQIVFESPAWKRWGQIADSWVQITLHSSKANCNLLGKREKLNLPYVDRITDFPGGTSGKEPSCKCRRYKRCGFNPWVGKIPWRRAWQPTPVFLPGESHGENFLVGCIVHGVAKSQTWLKWLSMHAHMDRMAACYHKPTHHITNHKATLHFTKHIWAYYFTLHLIYPERSLSG